MTVRFRFMNVIQPSIAVTYLAFVLVVSVGCNDGLPRRVPVSGKVTIDGEPLTSGSIRFKPSEGRVATGSIGSDGSYLLSTYEPGDGCVPGTYCVTVHAFEDLSDTTRRWLAPKNYAMPKSSGLTATIDQPTDSLDFELTWGGQKGPFVERLGE